MIRAVDLERMPDFERLAASDLTAMVELADQRLCFGDGVDNRFLVYRLGAEKSPAFLLT